MSISQEGKDISRTFADLRDAGFLVYNFNTQKPMKSGAMNKLCDHIVLGNTGMHFIEVKLFSTKDKMNPKQQLFAFLINKIADKSIWINYWLINKLDDAVGTYDAILNGTEQQGEERLDDRE